MPDKNQRGGKSPRVTQQSEWQPLVDREVRNPYIRWLMHLGVPVSVSIGIHVLLFTFLALRSWQVFGSGLDPDEYEVEITDSAAGKAREGLQWPGEHRLDLDTLNPGDEVDPFEFDEVMDRADLGDLARNEIPLNPGEIGGGGFGIGESGRSGVLGIGEGAGRGGGGGIGHGFGTGSGVGKAGVWNLKASGETFAYVVDFSGSIIVAVDELKRELKRSIGKLTAKQHFAVYIFYSVGDQSHDFRTEAFAARLQPATPDVKRRFFSWIDGKRPQGRTEPLQAMKRALALNPDAIFFFSDGVFKNRVVTQIAKANDTVGSQIHCLVFDELLLTDMSGLPRLTEGARRLKRIAEESGGKTKVVSGADLERK